MKNIFKKLDTLPPADRATALMSRWIGGGALWLFIAFCWPMFILWSIILGCGGFLAVLLVRGYRSLRDGMIRKMTREDRQAGRTFG